MPGGLSSQEALTLAAFTVAARALLADRIEAVTLFGSRARGEGRDDSDLDVLVSVRAMTRADRRAVIDLSADVGVAHGLVVSALVVDAATFRWDLSLGRAIRADGRPL